MDQLDVALKAIGITFVITVVIGTVAGILGFNPAAFIANTALFIGIYQILKKDSK